MLVDSKKGSTPFFQKTIDTHYARAYNLMPRHKRVFHELAIHKLYGIKLFSQQDQYPVGPELYMGSGFYFSGDTIKILTG